MSAEAQLEALLEIINTSARQAIAEYKKEGNEVPTIHSKIAHPVDFATDTVALKKAIRTLEGSCQQLCVSLAPPQHTLRNMVMHFEEACMGVAIRAKIADALGKYPKGLRVNELAKLVGLEEGKLARLLRLLATKGCFTEVEPNVFANNRISLFTLTNFDVAALWVKNSLEVPKNASTLYKWMSDPEYTTNADPSRSPVVDAFRQRGFKGGFFEWMEQDAERLESYHRAMTESAQDTLSVLHQYPWNEVTSVCDVGAGAGGVSIPLSKMYPHLKIVNHDLPEVLNNAKSIWARDAPEALQNGQVEFIPLDFFEGSPVKDQDVYYLRRIIHDWPDSRATVILRNVRQAMAPHSRLLIHDHVLTPACRDPNANSLGMDVAPEPLLPNFGNGNNRMYQVDLNMWFVHNAKERTLHDFIALGSASGLQLEKVYDLAEFAVLEFRAT